MKSLMLKVNHENAAVTLGHPNAEPGHVRNSIRNVRIENIPDNVTPATVIQRYEGTADMTHIGDKRDIDPMLKGRCVFQYDELGLGRILRE